MLFWAVVDIIRDFVGLSPVYIPLAGKPDEFAFLNSSSTVPGETEQFYTNL